MRHSFPDEKKWKGEKKMPKIFVDFRPAEVRINSEVYVSYYVMNPLSDKLERKRVRCNHIGKRTEQIKFARLLCQEINRKLYAGWNPYRSASKKSESTTIQEAVESYIAEKEKELRPDSMRSYYSFSKSLLKYAKKQGITLLMAFNEWHAENLMAAIGMRKNVAARTYNNYLIFYKTIFNCFVKRKLLKENPFDGISTKRKDEKRRTTIDPSTRKKIAEYFIESGQTPYLYIMQLCFKCFIRPKEILMLRIRNIDYKEGVIEIPSEISKNHKSDVIGVPAEIMEYFEKIKGKNPNHYIFSTGYLPGSKLLNSRDTAKTWSIMRKKLGLPMEFQFYSLKDSGITEMLESGVPAKFVKDLARHSSLEITEKYVHKSSAKKILSLNKLEF